MRQVKDMVHFLTNFILKKDLPFYEINEVNQTDTDFLHEQLNQMINEHKICEAEDLLFERMDKNDIRYLEVAVDFYTKLNQLDTATLEQSNFSRDEIKQGLEDAAQFFDVTLP